MNLIIVESPTKAKTLNRFLGKEFQVESTKGHIKDLPKSRLAVDIENNFEPEYVDVARQKDTIKLLKKSAKNADKIFLATDPDREGEAISSHVKEILTKDKMSSEIKRIVFHEITKTAVLEAIEHPRDVNRALVNAQIARRVLDRLVGYKVSPLLWKKVRRGLSAGRVQSVAVRLIVERERDIEYFKPEEYWEIGSLVSKDKNEFLISLYKKQGKRVGVKNAKEAKKIVDELKKHDYIVEAVKKREVKSRPYAPLTTSTMTQSASNLFGWSAKRTMSVAQKLYEQGLITYHRTDSTNISKQALEMARGFISSEFGKDYLPDKPNLYKTKSKSAQEAHEAIRVTDVNLKAGNTKLKKAKDQSRLYDLIWKRFLASQMKPAVYDSTTVDVACKDYILRATGKVMKFDGFRRLLPVSSDKSETLLPVLEKEDKLELAKVLSEQKFTQPPPRYNEASLIKTLEKLGIGRPSTYAPVISTIQSRNYVEKREKRFYATSIGIAVNDFLVKHFPETFDYNFTAKMEDNLDQVAAGKIDWQEDIKKFYKSFEKKLDEVLKNSQRVKIPTEKTGEKCPDCGKKEGGELVIRLGRYGKFISCSRFPECDYTRRYIEKIDMSCPNCQEGEVIIKRTKRGRTFYGCSRYPECDWASWKDPQKEDKESS